MSLLASLLSSLMLIPVAAFTAPAPAPRVDVSDVGWEATDPIPTTPCLTEDSAGPCIWDANTRGNGRGTAFWVDSDQTVHYFGEA